MISKLLRTSAYSLALFAIAMPAASAQDFVGFSNDTGTTNIPDFNVANNIAGSAISTITITEEDSLTIGDLAVCIDGLTHTWVGDLIATVTHTPLVGDDVVRGVLFDRVGRFPFVGDGDASNLDGDYEFASTGDDLWSESNQGSSGNGTQGTVDDEFTIAEGSYANVNFADFSNNTFPGVESPISLRSVFGGRSSAGTWTIQFTDNDVNDVGSFDSTSIKFFAAATAVPEPGTYGLMAFASIGGFFYIRRKKKNESAKTETAL